MRTLAAAKPDFSAAEVRALVREKYGHDAPVFELVGERDQNFRLGDAYVLKIAHAAEDPVALDLQHSALRHLHEVADTLPLPRLVPTLSGQAVFTIERGASKHLGRCVTLLPGEPVRTAFVADNERRELGALLARLGVGLRGLFHPAARRELAWDLQQAPMLRPWVATIANAGLRRHVCSVLDEYDEHVAPVLPRLRAQVIHNDANPDNLLVAEGKISGIVDFGDIVYAPLICDLAIACAYQLGDEPIATIAPMVAAYNEITPLEPLEVELLPRLIATRLAATIAISSWRATGHRANREYILTSQAYAIDALERLRTQSPARAAHDLAELSGLGVPSAPWRRASEVIGACAPEHEAHDGGLVARRERALGPAYRLFYDEPVNIVRGADVWLFDAQGRRYLDAYNNVACVGHSHPRVVAALTRQVQQLNTHSRYLNRHIVDYAERLGALLPFDDPVCMFCCTGSEANELAYRIAVAHTGARGVVVTDHAYHGTGYVTAQLSTADTPPPRRENFVATIEAPDSYRGAHRYGRDGLAAVYAGQVETAMQALAARGVALAALLVDTIFSCDGIVTVPEGFLQSAAASVRAAGGLLIADEVQAGFARTGEGFWGFERHGCVPDIVTLGKPMGNGHPLAAVICERSTVAAFAAQTDYFNTFGGSPVAAAVGMAVLDVLQHEGLQRNALVTGNYLRGQLRERQARHASVGDVRGAGLFVGVELVADRGTLTPATALARHVVNAMRQRGVLLSATGPRGNVLKLRPPLVFGRAHADTLLAALDETFASLPDEFEARSQ